LGAIALACGWPEERAAALGRLADRLTHGVREDAVGLARIRARGLGRSLLRRLVDAGFATREDLRAAAPEALREALRHRGVLAPVEASGGGGRAGAAAVAAPRAAAGRAADAEAPEAPEAPPGPAAAPLLTVDLRERRVVYRGVEIPTRP